MGIFDPLYRRVAASIVQMMAGTDNQDPRKLYYTGNQRPQLKVSKNNTDDNLIVNLVGLAVDRSVAHVLAGGVEFKLPEVAAPEPTRDLTTQEIQPTDLEPENEPENLQQDYIDDTYEVNRKQMLLLNLAINAAVHGTGYVKIKPDGLMDPYTGLLFPRLIALNPEYLEIETDPHDQERVTAYVIQYTVGNIGYRETTRLAKETDYSTPGVAKKAVDQGHWVIINEEQAAGSNIWRETGRQEFPYNFPDILHYKNLPSLGSVKGTSDIDDILGMQDKSNYTISAIQKQVRLQAHKQPWGRGIGSADQLSVGPDSMIVLKNDNAEVGVLDFQTDISGSLAFAKDLRQSIFDVAREVDITSITDKLGALTNFGLRVLYTDAIGKNDTKRMLLGEFLEELNRRLLVLKGWEGELSRPGEVVWQDPLPVNILEKYQAQAQELANKTVDPQTIAEENGRDWEEVSSRLKESASATDNMLGSALLRSFPPIGGGSNAGNFGAQPGGAAANQETPVAPGENGDNIGP
jgi:hypothetical protein